MKIRNTVIALGAFAIISPIAFAKQDIQAWPIADVMENPDYQEELRGVDFSWGDALVGQPIATSTVARATRGVMRTDQEACERAFIDALREMRLHALQRGAHSVQAIKSTIAGAPYSSESDFLCLTGHTNSRVELQGKIVVDRIPQRATSRDIESDAYAASPDASAPYADPYAEDGEVFEQRTASPRPVSTPHIDPEQDALYGAPWEQD